VGVDVNERILSSLANGGVRIRNEDGLEALANEVFRSHCLSLSPRPETADVFIIAVPTPFTVSESLPTILVAATAANNLAVSPPRSTPERHVGDLSHVSKATHDLIPYLKRGNLVILESTVPPGTTENLVRGIIEDETGLVCGRDCFLAHAPERVLPGHILHELVNNDRIVGGVDPLSTDKAAEFYRTFVSGHVVPTNATTAELVKLMENTYRDVNIALANEFALIAERLGLDVFRAISLANLHPRVNILKPGPGVGGHCIAVDPYFIVQACPDRARLIALSREINSSMPQHVVELLREAVLELGETGAQVQRVTVLGAAYKANVDDDRESPALEVARLLRNAGYSVEVHDPLVGRYSAKPVDDALRGSDAIVLVTDHSFYKEALKPETIYDLMRTRLILDTRGFFGPEWEQRGFKVKRLGVG
jgi:UDP-N-acetyl-D-mannosaminuronic acid dehydrogenase